MLKVCLDCTARYLPGVRKCPQCFGMSWRPDYEEEDMPKITATGGASNAAAEAEAPAEEAPAAEAPAAAEETPKTAPKAKASPKAAKPSDN